MRFRGGRGGAHGALQTKLRNLCFIILRAVEGTLWRRQDQRKVRVEQRELYCCFRQEMMVAWTREWLQECKYIEITHLPSLENSKIIKNRKDLFSILHRRYLVYCHIHCRNCRLNSGVLVQNWIYVPKLTESVFCQNFYYFLSKKIHTMILISVLLCNLLFIDILGMFILMD